MKKVSTIIACAVLAACNSVTDRNCNIEGKISQMDGTHAGRFLANLQSEIDKL